uniref:Uncharacterized protein n=1 Tax=Sphaerodactylus townsendi TaxID=933632 RepID=A0ACB8EER3_9SAUR
MRLPASPPSRQTGLLRSQKKRGGRTKSECRLANGTAGQVRFLDRLIWDRQEFVRFDSRRGTFEGVTELGEPLARDFNSHKETLDVYRTAVDVFCRHNWGGTGGGAGGRPEG